jgi:predicted Zn-dependent protease
MKDILSNIDAVASDLEWRAGTATPTIRVSNLMVTGL